MAATAEAKRHATQIAQRLARAYPDAHCSLDHKSPLQLLIATILSAQCTDERVNIVTKSLFRKYRTPKDYADAPIAELEEDIRTTGFYRNKAKNIKACCRKLIEDHHGEVPQTLEELVELPGVGRKTANVVLGVAFGKAVGVVVDTHVTRLSRRLGMTKATDPVKIEADLMAELPRSQWIAISHRMIYHGRAVCNARKPDCEHCTLSSICPRMGVKATETRTVRPPRSRAS